MKKSTDMTMDEILNYSVPYEDEYIIYLKDFDKICFDKTILHKRIDDILHSNIGEYGYFIQDVINLKFKLVGNKRVISFDSTFFLNALLMTLGRSEDVISNENKHLQFNRQELMEYVKKVIKEVKSNLKNGKDVEKYIANLYYSVHGDYASYENYHDKRYLKQDAEDLYKMLSRVSINLEAVCNELENPIEEKYFAGVNRDKFMLFNSAMAISICRNTCDEDSVHNAIYTVMKYLLQNKDNNKTKLGKELNCLLLGGNFCGVQLNNWNYEVLNHYYIEYKNKHSKLEEEIIPESFYEGKNIEDINQILKERRSQFEKEQKLREELSSLEEVCWTFLPSGSKNIENRVHMLTPKVKRDSKYENSRFAEIFKEKIDFFESNKPVAMVQGKEKFEGYEGYIYLNGIVFLEMLNSKKSNSKNTALYVMTINNFVEFSKKSKPEIIEIIKINRENNKGKENSMELGRIIHRKGWEVHALEYMGQDLGINPDMFKNYLKSNLKRR